MKKIYEDSKKIRLDKYLSLNLKHSRTEINKIINSGSVTINSKVITKQSALLKLNDVIVFEEISKDDKSIKINSNFKLNVIYEDDDLIVISKESGISVHPSFNSNSETIVDLLLKSFPDISKVGEKNRPGIVHRIDKGTSGLMVIAKKIKILEDLKNQFKERKVLKEYVAIVHGITKVKGIIDAPIGRHPTNRKKRALINSGKNAYTSYEKIENKNDLSFLKVAIQTGRTHQIRVHLSSIGHPIYGDTMYSRKFKNSKDRMLLHSYRLKFFHPVKKIYIDLKDKIPEEFGNHFRTKGKVI
tara:strand:- start:244 stop:1143 length:900 start_codon:yes stop_codon:yes gene_type:complete